MSKNIVTSNFRIRCFSEGDWEFSPLHQLIGSKLIFVKKKNTEAWLYREQY